MATTHLSIVFNHRFDANLARLDPIYGPRFKTIRYLVPFYDGDRPDVIPVYQASSEFQGFFAQAYRDLATLDADFFAFVGDDLLLHPRLDENNLATELNLRTPGLPDAAYIKHLIPVAEKGPAWPHGLPAMRALRRNHMINFESEIPSPERALEWIERHGARIEPMSRRQALMMIWKGQHRRELIGQLFFALRQMEPRPRYPLLAAYSDLIVVPRAALRDFCRWCGVLAAMRVFVEVGAPTALAWACERIVTEAQTRWHGVEYWGPVEIAAGLAARVPTPETTIQTVLAGYADDELYVHPIKLSKFAKPSPSPAGAPA